MVLASKARRRQFLYDGVEEIAQQNNLAAAASWESRYGVEAYLVR